MNVSSQNLPASLRLDEIAEHEVGGKAAGLAQLASMGLSVPPAFVIINAQVDRLPDDLLQRYDEIGGGKVAVRSSAIGEDGEHSSFAGLYETILNVEGIADLEQAVADCIRSLHSARTKAYNTDQAHIDGVQMCVVVQKMVSAASAGVLFSADPVSGRHDRLVIDAVPGLGESLVSGEVTPDHYELDLNDTVVRSDLVGDTAILSPRQITALAGGARAAVSSQGEHLDMEWAFDDRGELHWLQARPITTLGVDLNDGYTPIPADQVITRCNVGEMMPGPVCPLTFTTQGRAIEHGMQHMHVCYAGRPAVTNEWTQINLFYGHMFINLSGGLASSRYVSLTDAETMGQTMCGRVIPELTDPVDKKSLPRRWWGSIQFVQFCRHATRVIAEFENRFWNYRLPLPDDSVSMSAELETTFNWLLETDEVHLRSSAYSGLMEGVVEGIVSGRNKDATPEQAAELQAEAARLLAGATDVESAVMVEQLDEVVDLIARDSSQAAQFHKYTPEEGLEWLQSQAAGESGLAFGRFLERHGHRGYRELCVREKAWREEPVQVVMTMQASIAARLQGNYQPRSSPTVDLSGLSAPLRWLLPAAHKAIRQREQTKSLLVEATYRLKRGYRHLGELLVREGKLPDADLLYFMTREELAAFCERTDDGMTEMVELCVKRRRTLEFQQKLEFEDVHVGFAHPVEPQQVTAGNDNELVGRPVSRGLVEGRARVATTLLEAAELQPGEILVSHITDIGWTPYFSLIAGLATDVGSAVSHGAVIAREYGLPAIVNLRVATKTIKTGDMIRLDADRGILTRL